MIKDDYPLFPLDLIVYPGERLNLHIFEPRYQQLIRDALVGNKRFGIPSYLYKTVEWGTEVIIEEVAKEYADGRMDIKTRGTQIMQILDFYNPMEGKLYAAGRVKFQALDEAKDPILLAKIVEKVERLLHSMDMGASFANLKKSTSYDLAHHVGFKREQEYQLLQIQSELDRLQYIHDHLELILPILEDLENTKKRIKMNGHFKNFDPLNY
ncbi:MAG: LON peptidase substrate-binding domain-containing protein [Cyclobacteriaceae bacterium]|nr:LON peptidase substrate-binding domain-containing protein [Cyclobacteriaceae bacterium]MCH8515056.1 LON peptidase substrate-binding domain-containing protein [Cyclobacteriaceae bacterium]